MCKKTIDALRRVSMEVLEAWGPRSANMFLAVQGRIWVELFAAILTFAEWVTGIGTSLLDLFCHFVSHLSGRRSFKSEPTWTTEHVGPGGSNCYEWACCDMLWNVLDTTFVAIHWINTNTSYRSMIWPVSIAEEAWPLLFTHVLFLPLHNGQHNELQAACLAVPKKTPHDQILKKRKQNEGGTPPATKCDKTFESLSSPSEDSERTHSSSRSSTLETLGLNWARSKRNAHPRRSKAVLIKKEGFWKLNYTANRHVTNDTCLNAPTHERSNW